jgi:hypothetical protein
MLHNKRAFPLDVLAKSSYRENLAFADYGLLRANVHQFSNSPCLDRHNEDHSLEYRFRVVL